MNIITIIKLTFYKMEVSQIDRSIKTGILGVDTAEVKI
jgi:hypothetical protein